MSRQPDITIRGDAHGGGVEAAQRDSRFVERGDAGEDGQAEGGGRGRSQRSTRQDRAERSALVGIDRDPYAIGVGAPREHGREGGMAVFEKTLQPRHRRGSFGLGHLNFVHDHRLSIAQRGLPACPCTGPYKFI
jgi:hypothetical protein